MKKILFVCLGNICRSATAEAVMNALIKKNDLTREIECDSAGTIGYHEGEPADARMRKHAKKRNIHLTSISRKVRPETDFKKFDLILGMDDQNIRDLESLDRDGLYTDKIQKMTDFCRQFDTDSVPDPYYGGEEGFELVLDLLEDACSGLLDNFKNEF